MKKEEKEEKKEKKKATAKNLPREKKNLGTRILYN